MKTLLVSKRPRKGYVLLEVILAMLVFSIAITSLVVALHQTSDAAEMGQNEMRIQRILKTALTEALSIPALEEGKTTRTVEEMKMEIVTEITKRDDLENKDGQALQEMYRVKVTAHWVQNNQEQEISAETLRYGRLYQP